MEAQDEMRIYQPAGTIETLERLLAQPEVAAAVVEHRIIPERPAEVVPFPNWLDKRLVRALHARGIEMLYTHQGEAIGALRDGKDVVVVTPDDVEAIEKCQQGYAASGGELFNDISKGMVRADSPSYDDEVQMRAFWIEWDKRLAKAEA